MGDATSSGDGKCIGEQYIGGQCIGGDPDCDYGCDWEKEQETKTTPKETPLNIEWTPTVRGRWRIDEISMWLQSLNPLTMSSFSSCQQGTHSRSDSSRSDQ